MTWFPKVWSPLEQRYLTEAELWEYVEACRAAETEIIDGDALDAIEATWEKDQ